MERVDMEGADTGWADAGQAGGERASREQTVPGCGPGTGVGMSGPGRTLFGFVRHWSRRMDTGPNGADREHGRLVLVTEAVHALEQRGQAATVNAVAGEICIDQSGASRLIRSGVEAGYLNKATSADGRRRPATVTPAGHDMLAHAHRWQEDVFDRLTEGWPEQRRRDFQLAMTELVERSVTPPG